MDIVNSTKKKTAKCLSKGSNQKPARRRAQKKPEYFPALHTDVLDLKELPSRVQVVFCTQYHLCTWILHRSLIFGGDKHTLRLKGSHRLERTVYSSIATVGLDLPYVIRAIIRRNCPDYIRCTRRLQTLRFSEILYRQLNLIIVVFVFFHLDIALGRWHYGRRRKLHFLRTTCRQQQTGTEEQSRSKISIKRFHGFTFF